MIKKSKLTTFFQIFTGVNLIGVLLILFGLKVGNLLLGIGTTSVSLAAFFFAQSAIFKQFESIGVRIIISFVSILVFAMGLLTLIRV